MQNELVEILISERETFISHASSLVGSKIVAEDLIQTVIEQRLRRPVDGILDKKAYLYTCIKNAARNYRKVNKKYSYCEEDVADNLFEEDMIYSITLSQIKAESYNLTPKQSSVISDIFNDNQTESGTSQYETYKTHRRLAIIELKKRLNDI